MSDCNLKQLTTVILRQISMSHSNEESLKQPKITYANPVQNMSPIWSFFLEFMDVFIKGHIGSAMIAMSITICTLALYHEYVLMSMHDPLYSPVHPCQKNVTGVHWKIITKVFEIPKQIESPIKM